MQPNHHSGKPRSVRSPGLLFVLWQPHHNNGRVLMLPRWCWSPDASSLGPGHPKRLGLLSIRGTRPQWTQRRKLAADHHPPLIVRLRVSTTPTALLRQSLSPIPSSLSRRSLNPAKSPLAPALQGRGCFFCVPISRCRHFPLLLAQAAEPEPVTFR